MTDTSQQHDPDRDETKARDRDGTETDHPTVEKQAAENVATEPPA